MTNTNSLSHEATQAIIQDFDQEVAEHPTWSTVGLIFDAIRLIADNENFELAFHTTKDGYAIEYPDTLTAQDVVNLFAHALDVLQFTEEFDFDGEDA